MAKKLSNEDLVLNIIVNSNKAQSEIGQLSRQLQDTKSKLSAAETEMKKLERAGQTSSQRYRQLQSDVRNYNIVIQDSRKRLTELNQSLSLQDKSLQQLQTSLVRTRQLWRQATSDTDRQRYATEMSQLNDRIAELRNGAEQTANSLSRTATNLNKYIAVTVAGGASLIAFWTSSSKAIQEYAQFDDVLADVMKTTNLNKEAVRELNDELLTLQTRTSQEDLLGLSRIAGKLGYTEVAEISEFVRANNQIIVALNEDLGGNVEETVNKIGKLIDIFKLKDIYNTEDAFLKVGSAINELGMASTANEGYMVEFARRMAGVAPLAKISIDQILGLGAALDQLGQTEEVSSTALSKLFLKMASEADTYSKYAGMKVQDFKDLLEKDFMGAFTKVLAGVKNNSDGINSLADTLGDLGEDGGRVIGVIGSLANNVDILTESMGLATQAMKDGTSITDEYNIKNETAAAKLDMAKKEVKQLWIELGEKLWPVMTTGLGLFSTFISVLKITGSFISNNIRVISALTVAVIAYYTASQVAAKWEAITSAYMAVKRVAMLSLNLVYSLLTGNITRAAAAQQLLNLRMMANPYGVVAAAIVGLTALIVTYSGKLSAVEKVQKAINETNNEALQSTVAQRAEIERLNKTITDETKSKSLRLTAINRLREIMPSVLQDYSNEALMAGKATQAIENQTAAILFQAKIKAKQKSLDSLVEESEKYNQPDKKGFWTKVGDVVFSEANNDYFRGRSTSQYEDRIAAINIATKDLQNTQEDYLKFQDKFKVKLDQSTPDVAKIDTNKANESKKGKTDAEKEAEREAERQKKLLEDQKKYREEIINAQKSLIEQENIQYTERLKKAGIFGIDRDKLTTDQLLALESLENDHQNRLNKIDADAIAKEIDLRVKTNRDIITDLRIFHAEELAEINTLDKAKQFLSASLNNQELAQIKSLGQARKLIINQQQLEEQNLLKEQLRDLMDLLKESQANGTFEGINLSDSILSEEEKKVLEDRIRQIREELATLTGVDKLDEIKDKDPSKKVDVLGMSSDDWEKLFQNLEAGKVGVEDILAIMGAMTQVWTQYNKLVANKENAELQRDEAKNNKQKENLKKRLDQGVISQEQYNKQVERLDKELDRKKAIVARNQAVRDRNVALMSAVINTAQAVTKVLPNFILAAIVGAMGALQVATIASTPLPQIPGAESGGQFMEVTRAQDGKRFKAKSDPAKRGYVTTPTVLVGENGTEWVANADAVANPAVRPILDILDTAQKNGSINTLNLSDIITNTMGRSTISGRASGGSFVPVSTHNMDTSGYMAIIEQNTSIMKKLAAQLAQPITAEVAITGRNGLAEKQKEYDQIINSSNL